MILTDAGGGVENKFPLTTPTGRKTDLRTFQEKKKHVQQSEEDYSQIKRLNGYFHEIYRRLSTGTFPTAPII